MSKSYDNTIPLFAPREQLKKLIAGIVTDSRAPGEPKEVEGSALFQIYQAFASDDETSATAQSPMPTALAGPTPSNVVFERIDREIAPMREAYLDLISDPARIEDILLAGAAKARKLATPFMGQLAPRRGPAQSACIVGGCQGPNSRAPRRRCRRSSNTAKATGQFPFQAGRCARAPAAAKPGI
jgi:tryptophanyl-tRNA synthetase